jgi:hypothetical protein
MGKLICGIEMTYYDTAVQEKYSDQGTTDNDLDFGCGSDYGGET